MKVCYVTMTFPSAGEAFAASDIRALSEMGVAVQVKTLLGPPSPSWRGTTFFGGRGARRHAWQLLNEAGLESVPVHSNSYERFLVGVLTLRQFLPALAWLIRVSWRSPRHLVKAVALLPRSVSLFRELKRDPPDVVHLFWGHYPTIVGYLVRRYCPEIPLSVFLGAYDLTRGFPGTGTVARMADIVWTHAQTNVGSITEFGVDRSKIEVAYRGVDLRVFRPAAAAKISGRIVAAGRLIASKRMDHVVRVFAHVRQRVPHASLVLIGDGPERAALGRLADELGVGGAIEFHGHVTQHRLREEMTRSEVLVFLSQKASERIPNVVKEAMICECVCVVSETPGIEELILDGSTGFLVSGGELDRAADRIIMTLDGSVDSARIRSQARDHITTHFDARQTMRRYRDRWHAIVRRGGVG